MSQFIQPLENRVLMSVTATTLPIDASTISADVAAMRSAFADLRAEISAVRSTVLNWPIVAGPKTNRVTNAQLQVALNSSTGKRGQKQFFAEVQMSAAAVQYAKGGSIDGTKLLYQWPDSTTRANVAREIEQLSLVSKRDDVLQAAVARKTTRFGAASESLWTANPDLWSIVTKGEATIADKTAVFVSDATKFDTDSSQMADHLREALKMSPRPVSVRPATHYWSGKYGYYFSVPSAAADPQIELDIINQSNG